MIPDLQKATLAARARTGDPSIGTRARAGLLQVVSVRYRGAYTQVQELSDWLPVGAVISTLNTMGEA